MPPAKQMGFFLDAAQQSHPESAGNVAQANRFIRATWLDVVKSIESVTLINLRAVVGQIVQGAITKQCILLA